APSLDSVFRRRRGDVFCPLVVRLPARQAFHLRLGDHETRDLVARDVLAAVRLDVLERERGALARLDDGGDLLAPARIGDAHDERVDDLRVLLERLLDLFGEDLLTARVDALRAAAHEGDAAVGLDGGEVAREDPALSVRLDEALGRLLRILEVAERQVPRAREPADDARARLDRVEIVVEDGAGLVHEEARAP